MTFRIFLATAVIVVFGGLWHPVTAQQSDPQRKTLPSESSQPQVACDTCDVTWSRDKFGCGGVGPDQRPVCMAATHDKAAACYRNCKTKADQRR
jgi:hypothetical protein